MSDVVFRYGTLEDDMEDVIALCESWWYDSAFYKNTKMPFNVDREQFAMMDSYGGLLSIVGREEDTGELVACYVGHCAPYYFNKNYLVANEVVWCVRSDYRKGRLVFDLLKAIEMAMRANRVNLYGLALPIEEGRERLAEHLVNKHGFFKQDLLIMKELNYG